MSINILQAVQLTFIVGLRWIIGASFFLNFTCRLSFKIVCMSLTKTRAHLQRHYTSHQPLRPWWVDQMAVNCVWDRERERLTTALNEQIKVTFIKEKDRKHCLNFFLINSPQLKCNKKIHQHTTEVTVAYHKIYSIQRKALRILYKKTNKQKIRKSLVSSFRSNGTDQTDLLSISQCFHTRFANSQYGKGREKTFQLKTNLVG